ncbi:unnamed protein product [Sphagnum troendelagicum]|uniref:Uncharacterized protein n=1 Tax=Sphagnum troendelagicum TaxID=128251 RepID=A0ABP0TX09_9BRYO
MAEVMQMPQGFMAVAKSCLDEDYFLDIRLVTAHVVHQFLRIAGNILTDEERSDLVKNLRKRMDDSNDNVRIGILPAIIAFFTTMPSSFNDFEVTNSFNHN